MKRITARIRFTEPILGTLPQDTEIYERFIGSKAPDSPTLEDEVASLGAEEMVLRGKTVFPKDEEGRPFLWDYQIKGFYKAAASALNKIPGKKTATLKSFRKKIDTGVFVYPRKIPFIHPGEIGNCQRPLRANTMQGERVSLAISEEIGAGAELEFETVVLDDNYADMVREWLRYGKFSGLGSWRNSGKGRFELLTYAVEDYSEEE